MADTIRRAFVAQELEPFYVGATSAAFSANGAIVATPVNEDIVITDLASNSTLHTLEGDGEVVTALALTPDGSRLAVVSQSQQLRVFDVETGEVLKQHRLAAPAYIAVADATSSLFAFGATDGVVTVWDARDGYVTHSFKGHGTTICALKFHGELNLANWTLALGDTMGTCKVWNLVTRKCVATTTEHTGAVRGLAFSADGKYFMTAGRDEVVVVYGTQNYRKALNTFAVRHQVETCGFLLLGELFMFYTAGAGGYLKLWEFASGKPVGGSPRPLETEEEVMVTEIVQTHGGAYLWMVLSDQTLVELAVDELDLEDAQIQVPVVRTVAGNHGIIADIRYAGPDMSLVAMATNAPALRVVNPLTKFDVQLIDGHTDLLNCLDVSEDGMWILTGGKDNAAKLWQWSEADETFQLYSSFVGHAGAVTACGLPKNFDNFPKFVVTASADLTVKKWKVAKVAGETVKSSEYTRRAHDKEINALAVAPNDEFFATASFDKLAKVWSTDSGETVGILRGHKRGLWDISFCQYDKVIATTSGDKTAKVWSLVDYTCTKTLEGHTNSVQRCRFINKAKQLVTSGADGLVKVWDIKELECVATLDNHANRIWALDVKEDGLSMVSADADGHMNFWTDNTDQLLLEQQEKEKQRVEQEQLLSNYINNNDWSNAFLLALTLDHLMRLYNVLKALIGANSNADLPVGSAKLEETISKLDDNQMVLLLKKVRDWNINFKHFEIAQKVLAVVVDKLNLEVADVRKIVESIIPYNERHYQRLDDLIELSYMLDYAVQEMEKV